MRINQVHFGDCRDVMRQFIADGVKVNCVVTSPPYFGLRDYGVDGQIGLESTPEEYVANMVEVFRLVRDVLADDGVVWLNLGDSYAGSGKGRNADGTHQDGGKQGTNRGTVEGRLAKADIGDLKPKDLVGIPWRVAFALQADGWYLRSEIIWHKPNPMPESVTDRPTKAHEQVFLLAKRERYFYDAEAIKEPANPANHRPSPGLCRTSVPGQSDHSSPRSGVRDAISRNKRSVWTIPTTGYSGAHFAVFPPALIEPMILAGTSERGHCPACGARWGRVVEKGDAYRIRQGSDTSAASKQESATGRHGDNSIFKTGCKHHITTTGWQSTCTCNLPPTPDIVLDPFMGSGTTGQVAQKLGRHWLGIELNPDYAPLQQARTVQQGLNF